MANTSTWLSISTLSGSSGQTILTVNAAPNLSTTAKTAVVKAYNPVYNISATTQVTIAQYSPFIEVNPAMVGVPDTGGTFQISIAANCSYVIAYPDLVSSYSTTAATGNTTITFSVPSTSADTTLVGNIVITDESGQVSKLVRVEQYGAGAHISYSPSAVTIAFSGGVATFTVTADCIYNITKGSGDWYSVSPLTGYTGVTTFTVSSNTINTGSSDWTSSIAIVGPTGSVGTVAVTQEKEPVVVQIPYTADTSSVDASGETRVITIDTSGLVESSITVSIQGAPGATYTYNNGVITVNIPENNGTERDVTVIVNGQTTGGESAVAVITFPQEEYTTVQIPYTADTSTVDASGETRTITIDTTGLIESSITISVEGATGITYSYSNGVITVIFPENTGSTIFVTVTVNAETITGNNAIAVINYRQGIGLSEPLTFQALDDGYFNWVVDSTSAGDAKTIEYSINGGEWVSIKADRNSIGAGAVHNYYVSTGDLIRFRGSNSTYSSRLLSQNYFRSSMEVNIWGNIMSLQSASNYQTAVTLNSEYSFMEIFSGLSIYDATGLLLPATALTYYCYKSMFKNQSNLIPPKYLPATKLASCCYEGMFEGCTSLTKAPALPATNLSLASYCYNQMFLGCTSLTSLPQLPATTLTGNCYLEMFKDCTSITDIPTNYLPATTLKNNCYKGMFMGCESLTGVPVDLLPAMTLEENAYRSMFEYCTSLTEAPELPATTLAISCYTQMFYGCTSLSAAPELPATALTKSCYYRMFRDCSGLTEAPELPATTLTGGCYGEMFYGCRSLTEAPELPATTLTGGCYNDMFYLCQSLTYIKCMALSGMTTHTARWTTYVGPGGTFVKASSATWDRGVSGIPSGWTIQNA